MSGEPAIRILALPGSLREASHNRRLAELAGALAPAGVEVRVATTLAGVEPFDVDVEEGGTPRGARAFLDELRDADALLVATPEYNSSIPGQLKNALDWASRDDLGTGRGLQGAATYGRPAAVVSASTGQFGATWAADELRKVLKAQGARVVEEPRVAVGGAADAFLEDGTLRTDALTEAYRELLAGLVAQVEQLRAAGVELRRPAPVA